MTLPETMRHLPWWPLQMLWIVWLGAAPLPARSAECAQVTTWQQADFVAAQFPTVVAVNVPAALPGNPSGVGLATSIAAVPRPAGTKTLANNSSITIYSFASAAHAAAYYAYRRAHIVLPSVYDRAGEVAVVSTSLSQGSVTDLSLDALYRGTVILVAGYADTNQAMASGSAVSLYLNLLGQAQALVDSKCVPAPPANRPPTITLSPDPAAMPAFQEVMTRGHEFEIRIDDPDGIDDLDLGSVHVWVAGVDKTRHFLETVANHPSRLRRIDTATGTSYYFRPDSSQLMTAFNYFNIPWNGRWPVSFGICDRHGACARSDHTIYFGPYLATTSATWLGQAGVNCVGGNNEIHVWYVLGNNGHDTQSVDLLVGLQRPGDGAWWTFGSVDSTYLWHALKLVPIWRWPNAPSGFRTSPTDPARLTLDVAPSAPAIGGGSYQFLMAALEPDATDMPLVSRSANICPR